MTSYLNIYFIREKMLKLKTEHHRHLTKVVLKSLSQNRITTVLDFLQEDAEKLSVLTKLNLPQILDIRNDIVKKYSAPLFNGTELLQIMLSKKNINTGIDSMNAATNGGIPVGYITEICGLADSGKTQLCFQLSINCVKDSEDVVLYIDTKGDFSAVRIQKILDACGYSHKEMALIMHKIRVIRIWTMDEMTELFQKLKNKSCVIEQLSLIIIDSLPCLMFQYLGDESKIGLNRLNIFVNYSRFLCKELMIAIICVNIQTRWIDNDISDLEDDDQSTTPFKDPSYIEKRNRCLGKYWQCIPALVLHLEKCQENNDCSEIEMSVKESVYGKCNNKFVLKINNFGVT